MDTSKYYSYEPILSKVDLDGKKPSIFMINGNRSAGKTTGALLLALKRFRENGTKCALIYRFAYEMKASDKIFDDCLQMYTEYGKEITAVNNSDLFYELFLDGESFGFALPLSKPDQLKKYTPVFKDVYTIIFDEFQTESGKYLSHEVDNLQSILLSIARGGGQLSREIQLFMLANKVSLMNPYFIEFEIHKRLKDGVKFLRGHGWILEFCHNENATKAIQENGIYRAFKNKDYMAYSTENVYLKDSEIFIERPKGKAKYLCTIIHNNTRYGVREYFESGYLYVSKKFDASCKTIITFKDSDHNQNTMMLSHYSYTWKYIKDAYTNGYLRFDDLQSKNAIFDILAIDIYK